MATAVLQLAAEQRLSLSGTAEQHLPGLLPRVRAGTRHAGNESRITPHKPLTRPSGIAGITGPPAAGDRCPPSGPPAA